MIAMDRAIGSSVLELVTRHEARIRWVAEWHRTRVRVRLGFGRWVEMDPTTGHQQQPPP